jgi:hypothetical protein
MRAALGIDPGEGRLMRSLSVRVLMAFLLLAACCVLPPHLSAADGTTNVLEDFRSLDSGDLQIQSLGQGFKLLNYTFPDGQTLATAGILFYRKSSGTSNCSQTLVCSDGVNYQDDCISAPGSPYSCGLLPSGQYSDFPCQNPGARPCYEVPRGWYEKLIPGDQNGGAISENGYPTLHNEIYPFYPSQTPEVLHVVLQHLPVQTIRLALYVANEHNSHPELPPRRTGCFTVSNGGTSNQLFASVGFTPQGDGDGEFLEWQLSGSSTVDIIESTGGCGVPGATRSDGRVPLSGIFFLPAPSPPHKPVIHLRTSQVSAGGRLRGLVYTEPGATVHETLYVQKAGAFAFRTDAQGKAGPKGRFPINLLVSFHPAKRRVATLVVGITTPGGSIDGTTWVTIKPHR